MTYEILSGGNVADLNKVGLFSTLSAGAVYFNPQSKVRAYQPAYYMGTKNENKGYPLVFQLVGAKSASGAIEEPFDLTTGQPSPSNFFMKLPVAAFVGSFKKVEFPLFNPFKAQSGEYDVSQNPYVSLYSTIRMLSKREGTKHLLSLLTRQSASESAVLPKYDERYFFPSLVYQDTRGFIGNNRGMPVGLLPGDMSLPVVMTKRSVGQKIVDTVLAYYRGEVREGGQEDGKLITANLVGGKDRLLLVVYGTQPLNMFDPAASAILSDIKTSESDGMSEDDTGDVYESKVKLDMDDSTDSTEIVPYSVAVLPRAVVFVKTKHGLKPNQLPAVPWSVKSDLAAMVAARNYDITTVFRIPSHEEQIKLICEALQDKPEVLALAYPEGSQYHTADVRRTLANRSGIRLNGSLLSDDVAENAQDFFGVGSQSPRPEKESLDDMMAAFTQVGANFGGAKKQMN